MNERKTGFLIPKIDDSHFILGGVSSLPQTIVNPSGDWTNFLPMFESQLEKSFDSDGCTVFGTLNAIETLQLALDNTANNYSKRYVYNVVGITPPGSDPHLVATVIRGNGLIAQIDLPDEVSSLVEFETPRPMTQDLLNKGQLFLTKWQLGHEWLWGTAPSQANRLSLMKEALKTSPLGISVSAWYQNADGLYYSPVGQPNEHWCCCYKIDDTGIYVFDSYQGNNIDAPSSYLKKLTLDHDVQFVKRYSLTVVNQSQQAQLSAVQKSLDFIKSLVLKLRDAIDAFIAQQK